MKQMWGNDTHNTHKGSQIGSGGDCACVCVCVYMNAYGFMTISSSEQCQMSHSSTDSSSSASHNDITTFFTHTDIKRERLANGARLWSCMKIGMMEILFRQEIPASNTAKTNQILFWHENIPPSCSSVCGSTLTECYYGFIHVVALLCNINFKLLLLLEDNSCSDNISLYVPFFYCETTLSQST